MNYFAAQGGNEQRFLMRKGRSVPRIDWNPVQQSISANARISSMRGTQVHYVTEPRLRCAPLPHVKLLKIDEGTVGQLAMHFLPGLGIFGYGVI